MSEVIDRLALVGKLQEGSHADHEAMCVMEAVAFVAGEPWSDRPECACPVIGAFLRVWNDGLPDDERDALLRPLISRLVGTKSTQSVERRRALMAVDWLVRVHAPAWLRLAKLDAPADALASLPEITDLLQCPSLMPTMEAARAAAAWAAAGAAARDAARVAAGAAAGAAAWAAAWAAAGAAAWDAAWDAAWAAAWAAAGAAVNDTCVELQRSALSLVERMIAARA